VSTVEHQAQSHHLPPAVVADQQRKAVLFFILADAVFFACLLFSYFYLRALNVNDGWLPAGAGTASAGLVWVITGLVLVSGVAYRSADLAISNGDKSRFLAGALLGIGLVVVAIAATIYQFKTWPIMMSDGSYASMFIVMSGVQLVHLVILLIVAFGIWNRGVQGKLADGKSNHATVVGYFWYWVVLTSVLSALTTFFVS